MANQEQNLENPDSQALGAEIGDHREVDVSRRRFTGAGLGLSAIFTLASRPVLAMECLPPSGMTSGNLSTHGSTQMCSGLSPELWLARGDKNFPMCSSGKRNPDFRAEFSPCHGQGTTIDWGGDELKKVMADSDTSNSHLIKKPNPISKEFAAALLNIRSGYYPAGIDEVKLKNMWREFATTGQYQVTAGVFWSPDKIVYYLRYLRTP